MARQSPIQFTIPEPCHVPWKGMTPVDQHQRHCSSCERVIVDFTKMSDDELMLHFRHSGGNTCGRFSKSQLNRPFFPLPEKTEKAKWWRVLALIPLTLFGKSVKGQNDSAQVIVLAPDSTAFVQQNDSLENNIAIEPGSGNTDSLPADSSKIEIALVPDTTYKYALITEHIICNSNQIFILSESVNDIMGLTAGVGGAVFQQHEEFDWHIKEKKILNKDYRELKKQNPYKEIADSPVKKPKEPTPALPASNEITGILPEPRKKPWRS